MMRNLMSKNRDEEFVKEIISYLWQNEGPQTILVVADTLPFMEWAQHQIRHPSFSRTRDKWTRDDGMTVLWRVAHGSTSQMWSRGLKVDKLFMVDNLPWRTYESLLPCVKSAT